MSKFIEETKLTFILWKNGNRPRMLRFGRRASVLFFPFPWVLIGVRTEVVDGVTGETVMWIPSLGNTDAYSLCEVHSRY